MNADSAANPFGALDRLAARASGLPPSDGVQPLRPSIFEPATHAATEPEESQETAALANPPDWSVRSESEDAPSRAPASTSLHRDIRDDSRHAVPSWRATSLGESAPTVSSRRAMDAPPQPPAPLERRERHDAPLERRIIELTSRIVERDSSAPRLTASPAEALPLRAPSDRRAIDAPVIAAAPVRPAPHVAQPIASIQPARQPANAFSEPHRGDRQIVHVTIGRVEIRASSTQTPTVKAETGRRSPTESGLDTYLRRRALGSRS